MDVWGTEFTSRHGFVVTWLTRWNNSNNFQNQLYNTKVFKCKKPHLKALKHEMDEAEDENTNRIRFEAL